MSKNEAVKLLENLRDEIDGLRKELKKTTGKRTRKTSIKTLVISVSTTWTNSVRKAIEPYTASMDALLRYDELFNRLVELGYVDAPYIETLLEIVNEILRSFNSTLIVPVQQYSPDVDSGDIADEWKDLFPDVSGIEEIYLNEAFSCARAGWYRAATVLAWCAAADGMQRVIEREGFNKFNRDAKILNSKKGIYSKSSQRVDITDLSDYTYVNDSNTLLMLVYWGLLTQNEYARLGPQRTIRNHAAHPMDIPITRDDLRAFLRTLKDLVFENDKLKL